VADRRQLVQKRILAFIETMRVKSKARRIKAYMDLVVNKDDLRWVVPRHADILWDTWGPLSRKIAEVQTRSYNSTVLKPGAEKITVTAYTIGDRSKHWPRYRETYKHFGRLTCPYWVKTVTPWYEHSTMPYLYMRGRVIFWPGLDELHSTCAELDSIISTDPIELLKDALGI